MKKVDCYKKNLLYIKMGETTYYQRNRETILNRAKDYYENNIEVLREKAKNNYKELSEEDKNIKREHGRDRYKYEEKGRLRKYQTNHREASKSK